MNILRKVGDVQRPAVAIRPIDNCLVISLSANISDTDFGLLSRFFSPRSTNAFLSKTLSCRRMGFVTALRLTGVPYLGTDGQPRDSVQIVADLRNVGDIWKEQLVQPDRNLLGAHIIRQARWLGPPATGGDTGVFVVYIRDELKGGISRKLVGKNIRLYGRNVSVRHFQHMEEEPRCKNCQRWGHLTGQCSSRPNCKRCGGPHSFETHNFFCVPCQNEVTRVRLPKRDHAGNTIPGEEAALCGHEPRCINCKGKHHADDQRCTYYRHRSEKGWYKTVHTTQPQLQLGSKKAKKPAQEKRVDAQGFVSVGTSQPAGARIVETTKEDAIMVDSSQSHRGQTPSGDWLTELKASAQREVTPAFEVDDSIFG
ncbi:hypothetical protein EIP86_009451 [Pleurotus ostreatoroseus]|nr:hypothetical protein EIP86_009451 [Pleurotus ostreatoroseus]